MSRSREIKVSVVSVQVHSKLCPQIFTLTFNRILIQVDINRSILQCMRSNPPSVVLLEQQMNIFAIYLRI